MVSPGAPHRVVGILTRSDLLAAHVLRLQAQRPERVLGSRARRAVA